MILAIVVGVFSGVISSWIAWWVLHHAMAPKLAFSNQIKKQASPNTTTGFYYQVKIVNKKRWSDAVNVRVDAFVYFPDLPGSTTTNLYRIPIDGSHIWELPVKEKNAERHGRRLSLRISDKSMAPHFDRHFFTPELQSKAHRQKLLLENVLEETPNAYIRVFAQAMDRFTGAQRVFRSKDYLLSDIRRGHFDPKSLDIIPDENA